MEQGKEQKAYPKKLLPGTYCPFLPFESQPQHGIYINAATISIVLHKRDGVFLESSYPSSWATHGLGLKQKRPGEKKMLWKQGDFTSCT